MGKQLEMVPGDAVEFKGFFKEPISKEVTVKNAKGKRMAYKIKCSDNDLFKIRPVMGVLKDGESGSVKLTFTAKDKGAAPKAPHHFSLYEAEAKDEAKPARKVWEEPDAKKKTRHAKAKVVFTEAKDKKDDKDDKEEKKDDKKEEEKDEKEKKDEEKKDEEKKEDKEEKKEEEKKEDKEEKKDEQKKEEEKKEEAPKEDEKKDDAPKEEKKEDAQPPKNTNKHQTNPNRMFIPIHCSIQFDKG